MTIKSCAVESSREEERGGGELHGGRTEWRKKREEVAVAVAVVNECIYECILWDCVYNNLDLVKVLIVVFYKG